MTHEEAKVISERIYNESKSRAPDINHMGHYAFLTGSLQVKIEWLLVFGKFDFKKFDEKGNYDPFDK